MSFVPEQASVFVGREGELSALGARFDDGARMVTLVGPGGMGKTRVALRYAGMAREEFDEHGGSGVWFCDLASADDLKSACSLVGSTLGLELAASKLSARVVEQLGREIDRLKRVLLVLDNVEQIAPELAGAMKLWISLAPQARFLLTSRVALGTPGEQLLPLEPLALPDEGCSVEALAEVEAVALFLRRAREVRASFQLAEEDTAPLREIVAATDGIPLAIELAAARLRVLSLSQMRRRLGAPLDLMEKGDDTGRHASIRRAILDSLAQLSEAERGALLGASVFQGGFDLEAAEVVLSDAGPVLSALDVLVSRALVRAREVDGEVRFSLLETIREVAAGELARDPNRLASLKQAHARHFAELARRTRPSLEERSAHGAQRVVLREQPNLLAAFDHDTGARSDPAGAVDVALALAPVLLTRNRFDLVLTLAEACPTEGAPLRDQAQKSLLAAIARYELGEHGPAEELLLSALASAERAGDALLTARASLRLGELVELRGDTRGARQHLDRALGCLAQAPPSRATRLCEAEARARVGHAARREGDMELSEREARRALGLYREVESEENLPRALYEVGVLELFRRDFEQASKSFEEALVLARKTSQRQAEGALLSGRGVLSQEQGRLSQALADHAAAVRIFHEIGSRHREGSALYYLGGTFLEQGSLGAATQLLARAFEVVEKAGMQRYVLLVGGALAVAAARSGDAAGADRWLDTARNARKVCASEPALEAVLAIHEIGVAVATRRADTAPELARAKELALRADTDDVRFALRVLERACHPERAEPERSLRVRADGSGFLLPGGQEVVDLSARLPLKRILVRLAELRLEAPGEPLSFDAIVACAWPEERMREAAALNRVRVAMATLRKLGLRDAIVTGRGGYLIDPAIPVSLGD